MKFEGKKIAVAIAKNRAKEKREKMQHLETIVRNFESMSESDSNIMESDYLNSKNELEALHTEKIQSQILRSKCQWYEDGEKSSKYFLNLEKKEVNKTRFEL